MPETTRALLVSKSVQPQLLTSLFYSHRRTTTFAPLADFKKDHI